MDLIDMLLTISYYRKMEYSKFYLAPHLVEALKYELKRNKGITIVPIGDYLGNFSGLDIYIDTRPDVYDLTDDDLEVEGEE